MNLPNVLTKLTEAQNNFDSVTYADCFSENAVVFDEGKRTTENPKSNNGSKKRTKNTTPQ